MLYIFLRILVTCNIPYYITCHNFCLIYANVAFAVLLCLYSTVPPCPSLCPSPYVQSESLHINPLHTLIPSTMCVSFGVMLPVGNPPNAIVFSYGHVQIRDMVRQTCRFTCFLHLLHQKDQECNVSKLSLHNWRGVFFLSQLLTLFLLNYLTHL